jgi:hypothetical protein
MTDRPKYLTLALAIVLAAVCFFRGASCQEHADELGARHSTQSSR